MRLKKVKHVDGVLLRGVFKMLYGAIIGDISGSIYEFNNIKHEPTELLEKGTFFTDDTVMTVAVADALINNKDIAETMREWGKRYPNSGWGVMFSLWLANSDMKAYNSYGNGSAMRVSAVGWMAESTEEVLRMAKETAVVSHNHPEGIKGAQATALAIYLARQEVDKKDIKATIEEFFGYDLSKTCDEIRPTYYFNETCQETVPQAICAFLDSNSFEDCIKKGISLGGDSDTLCAISGSIAEAFYGVPLSLIGKCRSMLPKDMIEIINAFEGKVAK